MHHSVRSCKGGPAGRGERTGWAFRGRDSSASSRAPPPPLPRPHPAPPPTAPPKNTFLVKHFGVSTTCFQLLRVQTAARLFPQTENCIRSRGPRGREGADPARAALTRLRPSPAAPVELPNTCGTEHPRRAASGRANGHATPPASPHLNTRDPSSPERGSRATAPISPTRTHPRTHTSSSRPRTAPPPERNPSAHLRMRPHL